MVTLGTADSVLHLLCDEPRGWLHSCPRVAITDWRKAMSVPKKMTTGQMRQLLEIDASRGIHNEVQELIQRLTSRGVKARVGSRESTSVDNVRTRQAKVLWDLGWGVELGYAMFDEYLENIPHICNWPGGYAKRFDQVCLCDGRLPLGVACRLTGVKIDFGLDDFRMVAEASGYPYWMYCHNGQRNCGRNTWTCRLEFAAHEVGLCASEGVALYAQGRSALQDHDIDLPHAKSSHLPELVARLELTPAGPVLKYHSQWCIDTTRAHGSASRGKIIGI